VKRKDGKVDSPFMAVVKARPPKSSELRSFVRSIWAYSSSEPRSFELVMPGGGGQLIVNLFEDELRHWASPGVFRCRVGPVGLQGGLTHPVVIDTDQKRDVCGVAFDYGGLGALHDSPSRYFVDTIVDGASVFGDLAKALRETLRRVSDPNQRINEIEAFLLEHLRSRPEEDDLVRRLANDLAQGATISALRARSGLSQRRLRDLFDRRIGIRPKLFARIERFAAALDAIPDRARWSDLAYAHGFADQAHFIREFHRLSGLLPTQIAILPDETRHARLPADKIFNTGGGA
jgi:AraC-like DNA-binding protein